MKSNFRLLLLTLIVFSFSGKISFSQESRDKTGPQFAMTVQHPLLLGLSAETNENLYLYQLNFETNWKPKNRKYAHFSFSFIYGRFFNSSNPWDGTQSMFEIDFSMFWGAKNHFFELGAGTDNMGLTKAIIGYRLYLMKSLIVKAQILPTSGFLLSLSGVEHIPKYIDFSFGIGYQFNDETAKNVWNGIKFFISRSSIELQAYLVPFEKDEGSPVPPVMFSYGFMPFQSGDFQFGVSGGVGVLSGGGPFYQAGISSLYGKERHFAEAGMNFIFALLRNYNYEYKYSEYVLVQPQIGYRFQFAKERLFAKIAYAPYVRVLDWKREGGLNHNMVLGFGFRFGKQ